MIEENRSFAALAARYARKKKAAVVFGWIFVALAAAGLIGLIVALILLGTGKGNATLYECLCGGALGVFVLFGLLAIGSISLSSKFSGKEIDYTERADGENSFFVGEGTLAVFCDKNLRIHGKTDGGKREKTVSVPYSEMRFFSVCTRRAPKEKGTWSVVFEIPVKYLAKDGKANGGEPFALVQTDGKPRLYECLKQHGLTLLGEAPEGTCAVKKFQRLQKFVLPDREKRQKALLFLGTGVLLAVGGLVAAFLWDATVGALIAVVGLYLTIHGGSGYVRAKSYLAVYREGIYWKDASQIENVFLKWEEIESFGSAEKDGIPLLRATCLYGAYEFPGISDAYDFMKELHPEKAET